MMRQGSPVADILLYYGEDSNVTSLYGGESFDLLPQVPAGYEYDLANPTVLLSLLSVCPGTVKDTGAPCASRPIRANVRHGVSPSREGQSVFLSTEGGMRYRVLWLDKNCEVMSMEILQKIREYADAGVRICGSAPDLQAGLVTDPKAFKTIVKDIWHSGRPNVYKTLEEALEGIEPDCVAPEGFRYVHRLMSDGTQIYWLRNFSGNDVSATVSLRDGGKYAALLDPADGKLPRIRIRESGR